MALGLIKGFKKQVSKKETNYYKNMNFVQKESSY